MPSSHESPWIAGVCLDLAKRWSLPVVLLRLGWITGFLFTGGLFALLYPIASCWISREAWKETHAKTPYPPLARLSDEGWLAGVCSGLAAFCACPVWLMRLLVVWLSFGSFGLVVILYIVAAFSLPVGDRRLYPETPKGDLSPIAIVLLLLAILFILPVFCGLLFYPIFPSISL